MGERVEIVSDFYSRYQEEERLIGSRQGQLEFRLTMDYIHRYLKPGMQVLDIGAGTGRYSKALAEEGYEVKAVELVEANYKVLANKAEKLRNMEAIRGDALDLGRFARNVRCWVLPVTCCIFAVACSTFESCRRLSI